MRKRARMLFVCVCVLYIVYQALGRLTLNTVGIGQHSIANELKTEKKNKRKMKLLGNVKRTHKVNKSFHIIISSSNANHFGSVDLCIVFFGWMKCNVISCVQQEAHSLQRFEWYCHPIGQNIHIYLYLCRHWSAKFVIIKIKPQMKGESSLSHEMCNNWKIKDKEEEEEEYNRMLCERTFLNNYDENDDNDEEDHLHSLRTAHTIFLYVKYSLRPSKSSSIDKNTKT